MLVPGICGMPPIRGASAQTLSIAVRHSLFNHFPDRRSAVVDNSATWRRRRPALGDNAIVSLTRLAAIPRPRIHQPQSVDVNFCPLPTSIPYTWILDPKSLTVDSIPPSGVMPRFMTPRRPRVLPHENILHVTNPARRLATLDNGNVHCGVIVPLNSDLHSHSQY